MADDPRDFWESRYREREQTWSGRPNAALVDVVESMPPGRVLDLGSGEGGDSIWLALQGWVVTAVDVSATALSRARSAAEAAGVETDRIDWIEQDLATWTPQGEYDLVSGCFLQSPLEFPRYEVLRRMAEQVVRGGHLLVVSHASAPPWAKHGDHDGPELFDAEGEVTALALPSDRWEVVLAENRSRQATGPEGQHAELDDAVVLLQRR